MKKHTSISFLISFLLISIVISGCSSGDSVNSIEDTLSRNENATVKVTKEAIEQLIQSFPSPVETSLIIKNTGSVFRSELLIPTKEVDRFISSYDKALALGAYGCDMGYINIYGKSYVAFEYLTTIRTLSNDLEIDRFFNFEAMLQMAKNSTNMDTLERMSTESFNNMERYLREKGRDELSALIVFGTWLEGSYIVSYITKDDMSTEMKNRVAEQKESVEKINKILVSASSDPYFKKLSKQLKPLTELYNEIVIKKIIREPEVKEVNGELIFTDKSETIIKTQENSVQKIIDETIRLRNQLLK